ncbi:tetratricopeptide repeat protein [Actinoplanes sp. NPDC049599]|uniref:tetratricopeptide repeat protein n=1 Tax=Actinoplanes sp. NPDC049599 TaxID=3363903 RepID=UPI0037A95A35
MHGTVVGPSVQAGSILGGLHFHTTPATPPVVPRQLVAPPAVLVGRDAEIAELERLRRRGDVLIVLTGLGGAGKTFLARRWAHDLRTGYPDGQLFIDLNGFSEADPVDPGEALTLFLRAVGIDPATLPTSLPALAGLFRSWTADRSMLIVLDNALSAAQVRALLPASPASLVLVTSRSQLTGLIPDGAAIVHVGPLSIDDSVALMSRVIGRARVTAELPAAGKLARLCEGLPLTLSVVTARLARRPRLRLAQVAGELSDQHSSHRPLSGTEAVFDLSYRMLQPEIRTLYRRLSVNPGPEFGPGPVAALLAAPGAAESFGHAAESAVEALLEASLLEEVEEERFRMHDLLLLYARRQLIAEEGPEQRDRATRTVLEWYFAAAGNADLALTPYRRRLPYTPVTRVRDVPSFSNRDAALAWLETERVNLIAAGRLALDHDWPDLAWQFSDVMWPLLLYRKHYRDRRSIDEVGLEAARRWGNIFAEADMLKRLGRALTRSGEHAEAERHLRQAAARFGDVGDRQGIADAEEARASLYRDSGRTGEALVLFEAVLNAYRQLGAERSAGLALINLGLVLPDLGRAGEAVPLLHEARTIFSRSGAIDPYNGVRVEQALAVAHLAAGNEREAGVAATRAADGMHRLGTRHEEARTIDLLEQIARLRGDEKEAERHHQAAQRIRRSLSTPDELGVQGEGERP